MKQSGGDSGSTSVAVEASERGIRFPWDFCEGLGLGLVVFVPYVRR